MLDLCGVYIIRCQRSRRTYVGGTTMTFRRRFYAHECQLRYGRGTGLLQFFYDRGFQTLTYEPLIVCRAADVARYEGLAIDALRPAMNIHRRQI